MSAKGATAWVCNVMRNDKLAFAACGRRDERGVFDPDLDRTSKQVPVG